MFAKPSIYVLRTSQRRMVLLKSPFHYKTVKYNIGYKYYNLRICFYMFATAYPKLLILFRHIMAVFKVKNVKFKEIYTLDVTKML